MAGDRGHRSALLSNVASFGKPSLEVCSWQHLHLLPWHQPRTRTDTALFNPSPSSFDGTHGGRLLVKQVNRYPSWVTRL